jgi:uncharacterized YigZ family protein
MGPRAFAHTDYVKARAASPRNGALPASPESVDQVKPDTYRILSAPAMAEIRVRGSRFQAEAFPTSTREEAERRLDEVRRREYSATHHCWAYRIGFADPVCRFNDDGEPAGTAGPPILRQIEGHSLTNTLVVVTRYFGGTKLGTGGLIRAYGEASSSVLRLATVVEEVDRCVVHVDFAYEDTSAAMHTLARYEAAVLEATYSQCTALRVAVARSRAPEFIDAFRDALAGRGCARIGERLD